MDLCIAVDAERDLKGREKGLCSTCFEIGICRENCTRDVVAIVMLTMIGSNSSTFDSPSDQPVLLRLFYFLDFCLGDSPAFREIIDGFICQLVSNSSIIGSADVSESESETLIGANTPFLSSAS